MWTWTSHDWDRAVAVRQSLSQDAPGEPLQVGRVVDPILRNHIAGEIDQRAFQILRQFVLHGGVVDMGVAAGHLWNVVGFYRGKDLIYAARVRAGLVPATRREVFERVKHLQTPTCPFVNLPEPDAGRWGQGLTAEKIKECVWVRPELVARIQFLEWTGADHLRHTKFLALRDDKDPSRVVRES